MQQLQHTKGYMQHFKQASETFVKTPEKHLKNHCKHMQHPDETFANIRMKTLETYAWNIHVYATSIPTFATSR